MGQAWNWSGSVQSCCQRGCEGSWPSWSRCERCGVVSGVVKVWYSDCVRRYELEQEMQGRPKDDGHKPSSQRCAVRFIHARPHDMRNEGISTRSRRSLWCEVRACRKHVVGRAFPDSPGADRPRRSPSLTGWAIQLSVVLLQRGEGPGPRSLSCTCPQCPANSGWELLPNGRGQI